MVNQELKERWANNLKEVKRAKERIKERRKQIGHDSLLEENDEYLAWYYQDDWIYES